MTVKHGMREPLVRQQFSVLTVVLTTQNPRSEKKLTEIYIYIMSWQIPFSYCSKIIHKTTVMEY